NAKLNMAQRVSNTMEEDQEIFKDVPAVAAIVAELKGDIEIIREVLREHTGVNLPASTLAKRNAEKRMIKSCVKTANILYLIGFISDNTDLITLAGLSDNSFYRITNNAALALARRILNLAKQYAEQLKEYTIDEKEINEMETAIDAFQTVITKPMDTIAGRKQKTTNLVQLFAKLDSTLYDKLDKVMLIFKDSNPDFYNKYRTSRNLILTSRRKDKKSEEESEESEKVD
ncbi:MAG: hypothetical protein LBL13_04415, partial [Bacteroidales bacterium]|nr:hypothetical protein [Bacteroidales bacterium]